MKGFSEDDGCQEGNSLELFEINNMGVVLQNMTQTISMLIKFKVDIKGINTSP